MKREKPAAAAAFLFSQELPLFLQIRRTNNNNKNSSIKNKKKSCVHVLSLSLPLTNDHSRMISIIRWRRWWWWRQKRRRRRTMDFEKRAGERTTLSIYRFNGGGGLFSSSSSLQLFSLSSDLKTMMTGEEKEKEKEKRTMDNKSAILSLWSRYEKRDARSFFGSLSMKGDRATMTTPMTTAHLHCLLSLLISLLLL